MFGRRRAWLPFAILFGIAALVLFPFLVKALWNWLMPAVFHLGMINYWQALAMLVLAKILFGGFHGRRGGGGGGWRGRERMAERMGERMAERWEKMSPEERESFSRGMRGRCGPSAEQTPPTPASPAPGA